MKPVTASLALVGATLICLHPALAQEPTAARLTRPTTTVSGDKLLAPKGATIGNLVVDMYAGFGRTAAKPDARPEVLKGMRVMMCDNALISRLAASEVSRALKAAGKDERARLKARDPASLTALSITVLAVFDNVDADAIRADEALGPGVYHDAVEGFRFALDACDFYGQARRL